MRLHMWEGAGIPAPFVVYCPENCRAPAKSGTNAVPRCPLGLSTLDTSNTLLINHRFREGLPGDKNPPKIARKSFSKLILELTFSIRYSAIEL